MKVRLQSISLFHEQHPFASIFSKPLLCQSQNCFTELMAQSWKYLLPCHLQTGLWAPFCTSPTYATALAPGGCRFNPLTSTEGWPSMVVKGAQTEREEDCKPWRVRAEDKARIVPTSASKILCRVNSDLQSREVFWSLGSRGSWHLA